VIRKSRKKLIETQNGCLLVVHEYYTTRQDKLLFLRTTLYERSLTIINLYLDKYLLIKHYLRAVKCPKYA